MPNAVEQAHSLLHEAVHAGDRVLDATAGNGHDTVFLAQQVGPTGRVFAMDIQPIALEATRQRVEEANVGQVVRLIAGDHAEITRLLPRPEHGKLAAAVFNLGYLPGADKSRTTGAATTVQALAAAFRFLKPGGLLVVVYYCGHPGGREEADAVLAWAEARERENARVAHFPGPADRKNPPGCLALWHPEVSDRAKV